MSDSYTIYNDGGPLILVINNDDGEIAGTIENDKPLDWSDFHAVACHAAKSLHWPKPDWSNHKYRRISFGYKAGTRLE